MSVKGKKVGFVGAGNMGEALIRGLVESNLVPPDKILVADVRADRVHQLAGQYGLRGVASNASLVSAVDVVILAVKPQIMAPVLREAMPALTNRPLLISIAAGVSTATIQSILGKYPRLIRVMPNTPALVLQGVTAIARAGEFGITRMRSEEHTSELQSRLHLVCRLLLEKKNTYRQSLRSC